MEREILLSIIQKFAPNTQQIKIETIDRVVLNILIKANGIDIESIIGITSSPPFYLNISEKQLTQSLERLIDEDKVSKNGTKYVLNTSEGVRLAAIDKEFNEKIDLLDSTATKFDTDLSNLIVCLSHVFSQLGQDVIDILKGKSDSERIPDLKLISESARVASDDDDEQEKIVLAANDFFRNEDPKLVEVKWFLAQNMLLLRLLDDEINESTLSTDYFREVDFFIDTNILLPAIEKTAKNHSSYKLLKAKSKVNKSKLKIFRQNIEELDDWLDYQYKVLDKVLTSCPADVLEESDSLLAEKIVKKYNLDQNISVAKDINLDDVFDDFAELESWCTKNDIEVLSIDEVCNITSERVDIIKQRVKYAYKKIKKTAKRDKQAEFDAKLLCAIHSLKKENPKTWILTADTTLPTVIVEQGQKPFVITIDALLQWMSIGTPKNSTEFADTFSKLLQERLLPRERFFSISDFKIFSELEKNVSQLPKEDVINCLKHIRENVSGYDLSKAEDREKMHYEVDKYLKSGELNYDRELAKTEDLYKNEKKRRKVAEKKESEAIEKVDRLSHKVQEMEKDRSAIKGAFKLFFISILIFILLNILFFLALFILGEDNTKQIFEKYLGEIPWLKIEGIIVFLSVTITSFYDINSAKRFKAFINYFKE